MMAQSTVNDSLFVATLVNAFAGVLSGLFTIALIRFWNREVIPAIQRIRYEGLDISGDWQVTAESAQTASVNIAQSAQRLTGTCLFVSKDPQEKQFERARSFKLEGIIRDRLVRLSFDHIDRGRIGFGVFVVQAVGDGRKMIGVQANYGAIGKGDVVYMPVVIHRPGVTVEPHETKDLADYLKEDLQRLGEANQTLVTYIEELEAILHDHGIPLPEGPEEPSPEDSKDPAQLRLIEPTGRDLTSPADGL